VYQLLRDMWWPHPVHGMITIQRGEHGFTFNCACGETFEVPMLVAYDVGLVD
jgi:hypothetical protein